MVPSGVCRVPSAGQPRRGTEAETIPSAKRDRLVAAISALRLELDEWFSPEATHSGLSTGEVIGIINHLCGTDLPGIIVQA